MSASLIISLAVAGLLFSAFILCIGRMNCIDEETPKVDDLPLEPLGDMVDIKNVFNRFGD